jgi:ADP-ribosylglycohydrolase
VGGYVDGVDAWKRKPFRWRLPGLYTDDTQQALILAEVLTRCGRVDSERIAERYVALATPRGGYMGAHRAVSKSFRAVIDDLEAGVPADRTGQSSAGMGAAMRIAPVALFGEKSTESMLEWVLAASLITHRDIRSLAAAAGVALAIRRLIRGEIPSGSFLLRLAGDVRHAEAWILEHCGDWVSGRRQHSHSISQVIARTERWLDLPRDQAMQSIVEEANHHGPTGVLKRATQGFAPALLPACLYMLCKQPDFADCVLEMINLGGDADTAGAVLGSLAGAEHGFSGIPEELLAGLQNRAGIAVWADCLVQGGTEGCEHPLPDLIEVERSLCEAEGSFRDAQAFPRGGGGGQGAGVHR